MANNGVSQHFKIENGLDLSSDSQFSTLGANTKIEYKNTGEKYIKNSNYSNVFDKTKSFATESDVSSAVEDINTRAIFKIDDANSSGVASCKNANSVEVDTFTCHVSKTADNPTLKWGSESVIGTVDGQKFKVTMPANPNTDTKYYSGTAITIDSNNYINHNDYMDDQDPYYYHPCLAAGAYIEDNNLVLTPLTVRFNKQGHVTGYRNSDSPVKVDLSSINNGSNFNSGSWVKLKDNFKGTSVSYTFSKGGFILWNPTYENSGSISIDGVVITQRGTHDYAYCTPITFPVPAGKTVMLVSNNDGDGEPGGGEWGNEGTVWVWDFSGGSSGSSSSGSSSSGSSSSGSSSSGSSSSGSSSSGSSSSGSSSSGSETTEQGPVTKAWSYNDNFKAGTTRSTKTDNQSEIISAVSALTGLNITRVESYTWTQMTSGSGQPYYLASATYYYR